MARIRTVTGIPAFLLLAVAVYFGVGLILSFVDYASPNDDAILSILLAIALPILLIRARLQLDATDPFRVHAGDDGVELYHVTGRVEGAGKLADVHGGGGVIRGSHVSTDAFGNVYGGGGGGVIKPVETTVHDQFFVHRSDGYVHPVKLKGWDVAVADGHLVSAVWASRAAGDSPFVAVRNHSTRDWAMAPSSPFSVIRRNPLTLIAVIAVVGLLLAGYAAQLPADSRAPVYVYVFGGLVVGGLLWNRLIAPRFWRRFKGRDGGRIAAALDAIAGAVTAAPSAPAPAPAAVHAAADPRGALSDLRQLREDGLISSDDYEKKKQDILGRI